MSLRLRVVLIAGIAMMVLWALAAAWMLRGVQANLERTLDERLAMSAHMVASLLKRTVFAPAAHQIHWADVLRVASADGMACEVRSQHGIVLASSEGAPYSMMDPLPPGYSTRAVDGKQWRIFLRHDESGYQIMTADRIDRRDALLHDMRRAAGVPFLIAVIGGLLALWFGIDRGLAPLAQLRQTLRERRPDDTTPLDSGQVATELRPVIDAMNGWLSRLAQTLNDQRAFTDAAAHELRTPLTAIDTHLQVAQLTQGTPQAQESLLHAGQGVQRLRHTLEQMMSLARTDAPVHEGDACTSVHTVLLELVERLDPPLLPRVTLDLCEQDTPVRMPRSMLHTAVRNLLDNALRYAPPDTRVRLQCELDPASRICAITIADRGPGMSAEQTTHAGQRFWRGDQGRGQGEGAGLGISIVRAIARRFNGTLTLQPRDGGGLQATLRVPL